MMIHNAYRLEFGGQVDARFEKSFGQAVVSRPSGAPIRVGEASPLRVATGGEASLNSKALAAARPPTRIHGARTSAERRPKKGSENEEEIRRENLDSIRTPLYQRPAASLRSDDCPTSADRCPTWIGMGVRLRRNPQSTMTLPIFTPESSHEA